jgi:sialate O-acetylesterase
MNEEFWKRFPPIPGFDYSASFIGHGRYHDCPIEINGVSTPTKGWLDDVDTAFAIEWMKQNRDRPFSMVVGFKSPHSPRGGDNLPERLRNLYAGETSRPAPNFGAPPIYRAPDPATGKQSQGLAANSVHLDYLRHVTGADENLGKLLDALDELGIAKDTVVVYSSDNGYYLGEHGLGDKRSLYEESLRIPMLVRYPRLFGKGRVVDEMVLNIDLAPTFLDLAGVPVPREMQGVSWKALAAGQKLTVTSGDKTIEMDNILIGDVWVMNGQSNMAFPLAKTYESDMETATANLPLLRRVGIAPNESETLQVDIPADKIEGWTVSSPQTAGGFSAIGYTFGSRLQRALQIPIGIIVNARGGANIESLVPRHKFKDHPLAARYLDSVDKRRAEFDWDTAVKSLVEKWEKDVAEKRKKGVPEDKLPPKPTRNDLRSWSVPGRSPSDAAACYNGMFGAFEGLNIKGVLFHQGYNNAIGDCRPKRYRVLMKLMVEGWREDFKDEKLPVGVIEFCAGGVPQSGDNFEHWTVSKASFIREAQRLGVADLKDPEHTEFIPGYDQQIPGVHPPKKLVHATRAAHWALKEVYGMRVEWETAELLSAERDGDQIVLTFDKPVAPDDSGPIEGFAIAGEDGKCYKAYAESLVTKDQGIWGNKYDRTKLFVWSPLVKNPVAVRYAWAQSPMGNLKVNGKPWQPLHSFRTDKWDWPESEDPAEEVVTRAKAKEMADEAAQRCEFRSMEEAKQAVEILKQRAMLGKKELKAN